MASGKCSQCGKRTKPRRGNFPYKLIGTPVVLKNAQSVECQRCGMRELAIRDKRRLMDAIAFAMAGQPWRLRGSDVRFLRDYLGMTGLAFGKLVQVEPETLSRWEHDRQEIGKNTDRLIRFVVIGGSPELRKNMQGFMARYLKLTDRAAPKGAHIEIDPATMKYEYSQTSTGTKAR
jgi:YgiT-type zinc finger domain-containing protein